MIKVNFGSVKFKGPMNLVCAEASTMLHCLYSLFLENYGEQEADEKFDIIIKDVKKSDDEIKNEITPDIKETLDLLKVIMKGVSDE